MTLEVPTRRAPPPPLARTHARIARSANTNTKHDFVGGLTPPTFDIYISD